MKEIIALKEYTDKYISLYEGEIRNINEPLAERLIEQGVVAEHNESGSGEGSGTQDGDMVIPVFTVMIDPVIEQMSVTCDMTFADVLSALEALKCQTAVASINGVQLWLTIFTYSEEEIIFQAINIINEEQNIIGLSCNKITFTPVDIHLSSYQGFFGK